MDVQNKKPKLQVFSTNLICMESIPFNLDDEVFAIKYDTSLPVNRKLFPGSPPKPQPNKFVLTSSSGQKSPIKKKVDVQISLVDLWIKDTFETDKIFDDNENLRIKKDLEERRKVLEERKKVLEEKIKELRKNKSPKNNTLKQVEERNELKRDRS
jgi:hypothetical protein